MMHRILVQYLALSKLAQLVGEEGMFNLEIIGCLHELTKCSDNTIGWFQALAVSNNTGGRSDR